MNKKYRFRIVSAMFATLLLSSCGDTTVGDDMAEFKTVYVTGTSKTVRLESDVLTGNTCTDTGSSGGTFVTDSVDVDITSTVYQGVSPTLTQPVLLDTYTVSFTPATSGSPPLPDISGTLTGLVVNPGSTVTVPIAVAPDSLKVSLVNEKNLQLCSLSTYQYYVTINIAGKETDGTGYTRKSFVTRLNIAFADRS